MFITSPTTESDLLTSWKKSSFKNCWLHY